MLVYLQGSQAHGDFVKLMNINTHDGNLMKSFVKTIDEFHRLRRFLQVFFFKQII